MSTLARILFAVSIPIIAALSAPGCGGGAAAACEGFCESSLACAGADLCVLVDPDAAMNACKDKCSAGFAALSEVEAQEAQGCFLCISEAAQGGCFYAIAGTQLCDQECGTQAVIDATTKWREASKKLDPLPDGACTNGRNYLEGGRCQRTASIGGCNIECCNGDCGPVPDVSATCDTTMTPVLCTCTEGKNKGKTLSSIDLCSIEELFDLWNVCNL